MTEWWSWQGKLVEDGRKTMIPLDMKTFEYSKRALQVSGLVFAGRD